MSMEIPRVLIQGPGVVGRYLAARLAAHGVPCTLLDRDLGRARWLAQTGIRVF